MKQAYPGMTSHDGNSRRITIPKTPINLYFLAFYGILYQNLLHRRVYIAVSRYKLLLINLVKKLLHITFKVVKVYTIHWDKLSAMFLLLVYLTY